jgi:hypothetical protein
MTQRRKSTEHRELLEAEDRAIAYLAKFPPDVAAASALVVAYQLGQQWYHEILRRGENPEVFQISEDDFQVMQAWRRLLPLHVEVDRWALNDLRRIFDPLQPDCKWTAAYTVAGRTCRTFLPGNRQKLDEILPDLAASTPEEKNITAGKFSHEYSEGNKHARHCIS